MATDSLEVISMWKDVLKIDMDEANFLGQKYAPQDMAEAKERMKRDKLNQSAPKRVAWINKNRKWLTDNASKFRKGLSDLNATPDVAGSDPENFSNYRVSFNSLVKMTAGGKPNQLR